jgi:hypothetical protein
MPHAVKQLNAKFFFKLVDVLRQSRLSDMQTLGCCGGALQIQRLEGSHPSREPMGFVSG